MDRFPRADERANQREVDVSIAERVAPVDQLRVGDKHVLGSQVAGRSFAAPAEPGFAGTDDLVYFIVGINTLTLDWHGIGLPLARRNGGLSHSIIRKARPGRTKKLVTV